MMKRSYSIFILILLLFDFTANTACSQSNNLKLVFIRHGEKPDDGDNLNCQGLNRSMLLPSVLFKKFGKPNNIYIPAPATGKLTKRARMLQTITPFVAKYNLNINSQFEVEDYKKISKALLSEEGTVIIVWEHKNIAPILKYLGVTATPLKWPDADFDTIWVVTFANGSPVLTRDKEGLHPSAGCPF
jgi:hypothetical protein